VADDIKCKYRSNSVWSLFGTITCEMALPGKKWKATEAVCRTCRGPEYEAAYDCLYYRIGTKKTYSDKNEATIFQYCFLPPHNEEKSPYNQIKPSDKCGPNCSKRGYKKRPFPPAWPTGKAEEKPSSRKRSFWDSFFAIPDEEESPQKPKISPQPPPRGTKAPALETKKKPEAPPHQEPAASAKEDPEKEKARMIEGLLERARGESNYAEYEKAIKTYQEVLEIDPQNPDAALGIKKAVTDRVMKPWFK
jgi:hypothetical protein